jgi:hypothetical protein
MTSLPDSAVMLQQVFGQAAQPHAGAVVAAVALAPQQPGAFQLLQHAVQRGLGQPRVVDQRLQREKLVLRRDALQQRHQAQHRGVTVESGRHG